MRDLRSRRQFCRQGFELVTSFLTEMNKGTIARVTDRGFGFIKPEDGEKDLFFHANELNEVEFNDLREGDAVTFELSDGPKGPNATNVSRA